MDWKTTQKKDKDSLKKLIKQRYGVDATNNGDGVKATINGKTYNWVLDDAGMPRRFVDGKTEGNKIGIPVEDKQSIAPQKTSTPLKQSSTPLQTNNTQKSINLANVAQKHNKANVQVLQEMQNNPKQAQTIADNSFLGTVGGALAGAGTVLGIANNTKNNFVNNQLGIQQNPGLNLDKPSVGLDGFVPQVYASSGTSGQSKTDRQNEKWLKTKEDEAYKNIQQFFYDTEGTKDKNIENFRNSIAEALENGDSPIMLYETISYNGYRPGNALQKKLDWIGGGLSSFGDALTLESKEDDGLLTSAGKFLANIPGSAIGLVGDAIETVSHPVETAKGLYDLADTGADYLNYAITGDPLMDKSKATGEALKNINWKEAIVENPADVIATATGAGNALKGTKFASIAKGAAKTVDNTLDKNKITKMGKNFVKGAANYAYNPESLPKAIYNKLKPVEKTKDDLKKEEVDIAARITRDKYIDSKETNNSSSSTFTNIFGNEKEFIKEGKKGYEVNNKAVEELKEALKDIKIDEVKTYNDLKKQLSDKIDDFLDKQIEVADNTPKRSISDFNYTINGEVKNRLEDILNDIKGYAIENDQLPGSSDLAKGVIQKLENGEKISEYELLKIKRFYNKQFFKRYLKEDKVSGEYELKNPMSKYGQNYENNVQFLRKVLGGDNTSSEIRNLDKQISNMMSLKTRFQKLAADVRGEGFRFRDINPVVQAIDLADRLSNYAAIFTQIFKFFGWTSEKLTVARAEKLLTKNIKRLYELDKKIKGGGKSEGWAKTQFNNIMEDLQPIFDNNIFQGATNALKKSGKFLIKNRKQIGTVGDVMEGIEDKEFENKYMK